MIVLGLLVVRIAGVAVLILSTGDTDVRSGVHSSAWAVQRFTLIAHMHDV